MYIRRLRLLVALDLAPDQIPIPASLTPTSTRTRTRTLTILVVHKILTTQIQIQTQTLTPHLVLDLYLSTRINHIPNPIYHYPNPTLTKTHIHKQVHIHPMHIHFREWE